MKKRADDQRLAEGIPLENSFADVSRQWLAAFEHTVTPVTFGKISRRLELHVFPPKRGKQRFQFTVAHARTFRILGLKGEKFNIAYAPARKRSCKYLQECFFPARGGIEGWFCEKCARVPRLRR